MPPLPSCLLHSRKEREIHIEEWAVLPGVAVLRRRGAPRRAADTAYAEGMPGNAGGAYRYAALTRFETA